MIGYRLDMVEITDPEVLRASGQIPSHRVAHRHSRRRGRGPGLRITPAELAAADDYEVSDYKRVLAPLKSGRKPGCTCAQ